MPNPDGHSETLVPAHPGNANAAKRGVYSPRLREERAQQLHEDIMALPHVVPADSVGAAMIARLEAYIEALDAAIADVGVSKARADKLGELLIRAMGRHESLLGRFGMTPRDRAEWAKELATGGLAAEIARRRQAAREREEQSSG